MSVMEIVNQVKTMPAAEQLELFREIHQLEADQRILEQFNLLDGASEEEFFQSSIEQSRYELRIAGFRRVEEVSV